MNLIIALGSILLITAFGFAVKKFWLPRACPLCLGVSGTWFLMSIAVVAGRAGLEEYKNLIFLLIGGTVVGIAYLMQSNRGRFLVTILGMALAYEFVANLGQTSLVAAAGVLAILFYLFFVRTPRPERENREVTELEKKLKNCC